MLKYNILFICITADVMVRFGLYQLKQDWICMLQLLLVCGGVETTRALSLVVSGSETVRRPWYADNSPAGLG